MRKFQRYRCTSCCDAVLACECCATGPSSPSDQHVAPFGCGAKNLRKSISSRSMAYRVTAFHIGLCPYPQHIVKHHHSSSTTYNVVYAVIPCAKHMNRNSIRAPRQEVGLYLGKNLETSSVSGGTLSPLLSPPYLSSIRSACIPILLPLFSRISTPLGGSS